MNDLKQEAWLKNDSPVLNEINYNIHMIYGHAKKTEMRIFIIFTLNLLAIGYLLFKG